VNIVQSNSQLPKDEYPLCYYCSLATCCSQLPWSCCLKVDQDGMQLVVLVNWNRRHWKTNLQSD